MGNNPEHVLSLAPWVFYSTELPPGSHSPGSRPSLENTCLLKHPGNHSMSTWPSTDVFLHTPDISGPNPHAEDDSGWFLPVATFSS